MDVIDGQWIAARLTGRRGEKAEIARAMGISSDKLSKILSGERGIASNELPGLLSYFNIGLSERSWQHQVSEVEMVVMANSDASTLPSQSGLDSAIKFVSPNAEHPSPFVANKDLPSFGMMRGDLVVVDIGARAEPGDLVMTSQKDPSTGAPATMIMRWIDPWLVPEAGGPPIDLAHANPEIAVIGPVRGTLRGPGVRMTQAQRGL